MKGAEQDPRPLGFQEMLAVAHTWMLERLTKWANSTGFSGLVQGLYGDAKWTY